MSFRVGEFQALELIGTGGSASVFRGQRVADGYPVAMKTMRPVDFPALQREAALASALNHPHVPEVIAVLTDEQRSVLVTELAAAGSLAELLDRRGRLTEGETLTVLIPVAAVLAMAHERQLVHGDLSAANILFDAGGRPLLGDLGAARAAAETGLPVRVTPAHAAPEVARGGAPTAASDLFALGSVALACVSGEPAWPADDLRDVLIQSTAGQWPDPHDLVRDAVLAGAIRALLDPVAERRPGAAGLIVELRAAAVKPVPIDFGHPPATDPAATPSGAARVATGGPRAQPDAARARRARAVTQVRPDAAPVPAEEESEAHLARFPLRVRHRARHRGGAATPAGGPGRRWGRSLAWTAGCVAALALAVQAGLWWAGQDRHQPVAASAPATASAPASTMGRSVPAETASPTHPPATVAPGRSTRSSASRSSAPSAGRAAPPTRSSAIPTRSSAEPAVNWTAVVRGLDQARSRAFTDRDPVLLDGVYTADSPARAADVSTIVRLRTDGYLVSGARHQLVSVALRGRDHGFQVEVIDELPAYQISDLSGHLIGQTAARGRAPRVLTLIPTSEGYRIDQIRPG